jgi:threonine/homoserine/homoserine lactone efflux protein
VGPLALICIQRTVKEGRLHGIFSGIGVATADSFYAAVTFFGLTVISGLIIAQQYLFRFLAGVVLILIGIRVFLSVPSAMSTKTEHETYLKDYLSTVALAIANPLTLVFFLVILPGYGVVIYGTDSLSAAEFVAGVFFGSTVWWVVLCGSIGSVRSRLSGENLRLINRVSGLLISCFGAGVIILLVMTMGIIG